MLPFFILGILIWTAFAAAWIWLCLQARCNGWRGGWGKLAVQASIVALIWGLLRGYTTGLPLLVTAPPLLLFSAQDVAGFQRLLVALAPYALPAAAVTTIAALCLPGLRIWAPGLALCATLLATLISADAIAARGMCQTAANRGSGPILRHSFAFSLRHAPEEYQFNLHALTTIDGEPWGWSYRAMDWYPIPADAANNLRQPPTPLPCP
ncbi:hypothetical protein [Pseudorhodobacter sp.]|uniref:hypothetical protein n=1 Tax=Pseudorhodobacter sp. TaxID=1934400 RepID=UPI002649C9E9|nr:hypothetical protein [Pseudorhodobacter sp.]MDN5788886.1 hypothetical protein [Pseudorhodobacter sp.]